MVTREFQPSSTTPTPLDGDWKCSIAEQRKRRLNFFSQNDSTCSHPFRRLKISITIWCWRCVGWCLKKNRSPSIDRHCPMATEVFSIGRKEEHVTCFWKALIEGFPKIYDTPFLWPQKGVRGAIKKFGRHRLWWWNFILWWSKFFSVLKRFVNFSSCHKVYNNQNVSNFGCL